MSSEWNRVLLNWLNSIADLNLKCITELTNEKLFYDVVQCLKKTNETLDEFLSKEYPDFKRLTDVSTTEDITNEVLIASLLLHYACIKVKDGAIRVAMCLNLNVSDQKAIAKFVESLIKYESITEYNVKNALKASAADVSFKESSLAVSTPMKLNSTNNVSPMSVLLSRLPMNTPTTQKSRRIFNLEAELEAERFDRNFLQEDLNRKHRRIEELENLQKSHISEMHRLREELTANEDARNKCKNDETCSLCATKEKNLQEQHRSHDLEILRLVSEAVTVEGERDSFKDKANNLEKDLKKWQIHAVELETTIDLLNTQTDQYQLEITSLKTALTETTKCLDEYRNQHLMNASIEWDDDTFSKKIFNISLNTTPENLGKAVVDVQLREQLENNHLLIEQSSLIKEENNFLKQQIQRYLEDIDSLEKKFDEKNAEASKLAAEVLFLKSDIQERELIFNSQKEDMHTMKTQTESLITAVDEKETKLSALQSQVENIEVEKSLLKTDIGNLQFQLNSLSAECNRRETQLNAYKEENHNLILQMKMKDEVGKTQNSTISQLEDKICILSNQIQELYDKDKRNQEIIVELESKLDDNLKMVSDQQSKIVELEDELNLIDVKCQHFQQQNEEYYEQINLMENKYEEKNAEAIATNGKLIALENLTKERECTLEIQKHEILELKTQCESLITEVTEKQVEVDDLRSQIMEIRNEKSTVITNFENSQCQLNLLRAKCDKCEEQLNAYKDENHNLMLQINLKDEIGETQSSTINQLEDKINAFSNQNQELCEKDKRNQEIVVELESKLKDNLKVVSDQQSKIVELEDELNLINDKCQSFQQQKEEYYEQINLMEKKYEEKNAEAIATNGKLIALENLIKERECTLEVQKHEILELKTQSKSLITEVTEKQVEVDDLRSQIMEIRNEKSIVITNFENSQCQLNLLRAECDKCEEQLNAYKDENHNLMLQINLKDEIGETQSSTINQLEDKINAFSNQNQELCEKDKRNQEIVVELESKLKDNLKVVSDQQSKIVELEDELNLINDKCQSFQQQKEEYYEQINLIEKKYEEKNAEAIATNGKLIALENLIKERECTLEVQKHEILELKTQSESLITEVTEKQVEVDDLRSQIMEIRNEKSTVITNFENSQCQLNLLRAECDKCEEQLNAYKDENHNLILQMKKKDEIGETQNSTITQLHSQMIKVENEKSLLSSNLDSLQCQINYLNNERNECEERLLLFKDENLKLMQQTIVNMETSGKQNDRIKELENKIHCTTNQNHLLTEEDGKNKELIMQLEYEINEHKENLKLIAHQQSTIGELEKETIITNDKCQTLQQKKELYCEKIILLEMKVNEMNSEVVDLTGKLLASEHDNKQCELTLESQKEEILRMNTETTSLLNELEEKQSEFDALHAKIMDVENYNLLLTTDNEKFQIQINHLKAEINKREEQFNCIKNENQSLLQHIAINELSIEKQNDDIIQFEEKMLGISQQNQLLTEENLTNKGIIDLLKCDINEHKNNLNVIANFEVNIKLIEDKCQNLEHQNEQYIEKIELLEKKFNEKNSEVIYMADRMIANEQEILGHKAILDSQKEEIYTLKTEIKSLTDEVEKKQKNIEALYFQIEDIKKVKSSLITDKENLNCKINCVNAESKELEAQFLSLKTEKQNLMENIEVNEGIVKKHNETITQLQNKINLISKENKLLIDQNETNGETIGRLEVEIAEHKENLKLIAHQQFSIAEYEKEIKITNDKCQKLQKQNEKYCEKVNTLEKQLTEKNAESIDMSSKIIDLEKNIKEYERTLDTQKEETIVTKTQMETLINEIEEKQSKLDVLHSKIIEIEKHKFSLTTDIDNFQSQVNHINAEYQQLETQFNSIKNENDILLQKISINKETVEKQNDTITQLEDKINSISNQNQLLAVQNEKNLDTIGKLEEEILKHEESLKLIEVQESKISELEKNVVSMKNEGLNLKMEIEKYQKEVSDNLKQVDVLKEKLEDANERIYTENVKPLVEYDKKLQENIKLSADLKQRETEVSQLKIYHSEYISLKQAYESLLISHQKIKDQMPSAEPKDSNQLINDIRNEYEDKLTRMKQKMKQLYQEQIAIYSTKQKEEINESREKQKEEIMALEALCKKYGEKIKSYEAHVNQLSSELWKVGEKLLMERNEKDWLKQQLKKHNGSTQSLNSMSSLSQVRMGTNRNQTAQSRSDKTPVSVDVKKHQFKMPDPVDGESGGLHMSDEEGEMFDNRYLNELKSGASFRDLNSTMKNSIQPPNRLSELQWRNSLCLPHLKSSYPAETQFQQFKEEDIKANAVNLDDTLTLKINRPKKEVGQTSYKKPGPPTPSKKGGRQSLQGMDSREPLKEQNDNAKRNTTPSRIKALFMGNNSKSSSRDENAFGTPKSRRLSIFRKQR